MVGSSPKEKQHSSSELGLCLGAEGVGRRQHSLRVYLVECAVHAHRGPEPCQLLVLPQACQDGGQGRGTEVGRAEGDDGADMLHGYAVGLRRLQAQICQDLSCIGKAFLIPGQGDGNERPQFAIPWKSPGEPAFPPLQIVKTSKLAHSDIIMKTVSTMIIAATVH